MLRSCLSMINEVFKLYCLMVGFFYGLNFLKKWRSFIVVLMKISIIQNINSKKQQFKICHLIFHISKLLHQINIFCYFLFYSFKNKSSSWRIIYLSYKQNKYLQIFINLVVFNTLLLFFVYTANKFIDTEVS